MTYIPSWEKSSNRWDTEPDTWELLEQEELENAKVPDEFSLEELLEKHDIDKLRKDERIHGAPVNFLRGLNWNAKVIIADESQNMTFKELFTLITRIGEFSKVFILTWCLILLIVAFTDWVASLSR